MNQYNFFIAILSFSNPCHRTKIQIAERVFYFVLPPTPQTQKYNSDGEIGSDESMSESEEESGSLGSSDSEEESSGSSSSGEEESVEEEEEEEELEQEEALESVKDADSRKRPKLVLRKKPVPAVKGGKGKGKHQGKTIWAGKGVASAKRTKEDDDEEEEENDGDSNEGREEVETAGKKMVGKGPPKKAKAVGVEKDKNTSSDTSRKRKRGEAGEQEQQMPLKVGTPIGVEALNLKSKKKRKANVEGVDEKKEQQQDASSTSSSLATPVKGKGKGGGKAYIVAAALAAKAKTDEAKDKAKASTVTPNVKVGSTVNTSSTPRPPTTSVTPGRPGGPSPARPPVPASPLVATTGGSPLPRPVDGVVRPLYTNVRPSVIPSPVPGPHQSLSRPPAGVVTQAPRVLTGIHQGPISNVAPRPIGGTAGQAASISSTTTAPFPPSAAVFSHLTNQNPPPAVTQAAPLPPAGSGIKPELSNIDLIKNAFANPISLSRGGKLTLQEIYEDISSKHEWYRNNNRTNGRDWHSSIRHAVGNSKEMIRIPRKVNEQGKGVFYALSTSEAAKAHRLEEQNGTIQAQSASPISTPPVVTAAARPPASMSIPAPLVRPPLQPQSTPTNVAARPSPPIQPNGRVSIVIGKAPAEALAQMASVPKAAITQSIEALFGGPPIVHHEGKLFLNPLVFGDMSASEISDIGGKGAQQALAILQGHLVTHLQSKMKPGQSASPRPVRPPTLASTSTINGLQAASPRPNPSVNGATPPRPPIAVNVQMNRPPPARPGVALPSTGAQPMRPGQPSIGLSHVVRPPPSGMSSVARPQMNGTVIGQRPVARPTGGAVPTRPQPIQGQAMSPQQGRPPAATNGQTVVVTARPLQPPSTQRPPVPTIQSSAPRPVGTPATNNTTAATPVSRPIAPLNSAASSPLPRPPIARPAPASVSVQARPISTPTSTADPSKAFARANSSTLTPLVPPSSNAMMSAMQALASHPDAAGLMTLLGGGKVESGAKLTPGQLELLQRAGRIAAEQQKAQQGKRIDQSPPGKEQSIVTSHTQTSSAPSTSREDTNANPNASTDSPSK